MSVAPGCYGSVVSYDSSDEFCIACSHFNKCGDESYKTLQSLRDVIDAEAVIKKHDKQRIKAEKGVVIKEAEKSVSLKPRGEVKLTRGDIELIRSIGKKKPMQRAMNLIKRGMNGDYIKKAMNVGKNPFVDEPPHFLAVACRLIMNGGFSKLELAKAYQNDRKTSMSVKTAYSQVAIVVALLPAFGVIEEFDGRFKLSK